METLHSDFLSSQTKVQETKAKLEHVQEELKHLQMQAGAAKAEMERLRRQQTEERDMSSKKSRKLEVFLTFLHTKRKCAWWYYCSLSNNALCRSSLRANFF